VKTIRELTRTNRILRKIKPRILNFLKPDSTPAEVLAKLVTNMNSPVLLDIGANVGQFGIDFRNSGFKGKIISFEPVSNSFKKLKITSRNFQPWEVIDKGLGSSKQISVINVSNNSGLSSSLLKIADEHLQAFPQSFTTSTEKIQIETLDSEISRLKLNPSEVILKIDVQGFESKVIEGGVHSIPQIRYILLELSLRSLYENERIFLDVLNMLEGLGHNVIDIHRGVRGRDGSLLQVEVITESHRA